MRNTLTFSPQASRASHSRGFTLLEIMVVVVIIGLLASVVVLNLLPNVDKAKIAKTRQDIQTISTALTMYNLDNYKFPTTDQGLRALVQQPSDPNIHNWRVGGYVQPNSLKDPWGNDYQYLYPGTHGQPYDLYSFGPSGPEGEQTDQSKIGNWNIDATPGGGPNGTTPPNS